MRLSLTQCRLALTTWLLLVAAPAAQAFTERAVTLASAPATLHGTLTLPDGEARGPAVLLLPGSGPIDRNGDMPGMPTHAYQALAHALAAEGIISLRIDKRSIGASAAAGLDESLLRFNHFVEDAIGWLELLRAEPRAASVAVLGHSEGALVATLVARRATVARLVTLAGPGQPAGIVLEAQAAAAGLPQPARELVHNIIEALRTGQPVPSVPPFLASLFRPSVQPYMASWLILDPAAELAAVTAPVLILNGTTDIQVPPAQAEILHRAQPAARLVIIDGMNHVLRVAPIDRAANIATYSQPALPLAPRLVDSVAGFLRE